jgi:hypothetical protein
MFLYNFIVNIKINMIEYLIKINFFFFLQCLDSCPDYTYYDGFECDECDNSCGNCSQSANNCTDCPDSNVLFNF